MTTGDIQAHLAEIYGTDVARGTIRRGGHDSGDLAPEVVVTWADLTARPTAGYSTNPTANRMVGYSIDDRMKPDLLSPRPRTTPCRALSTRTARTGGSSAPDMVQTALPSSPRWWRVGALSRISQAPFMYRSACGYSVVA